MSHALPCLVAEAGRDQLVIAPHRAIEEYQSGAGKPGLEFFRHLSAGSEKIEMFAGRPVADTKSERIARAIISRRVNFAFQVPRALAGNRERQDLDAGGEPSGKVGSNVWFTSIGRRCTFFSFST